MRAAPVFGKHTSGRGPRVINRQQFRTGIRTGFLEREVVSCKKHFKNMYSSSECNSFPKSDTSALPALGASATKTEQGGAETQQNHNKLLKAGSLVDLPFCINVLGGI